MLKYRGSLHGTNEYPFLITDRGIDVVPITSLGLALRGAYRARVHRDRAARRHARAGIYRGSSTMISGSAGTGKTSIGAAMVDAACTRGERALFVSIEESPAQLVRNMRSIGYDLQRWIDAGLLQIRSVPPTAFGFEEHLAMLRRGSTTRTPRSSSSTRSRACPFGASQMPRQWSPATSTCSRAVASPPC